MPESRIQDWIRYVQENAENVGESASASTREAASREVSASLEAARENAGDTQAIEAESGAQIAEKRVAASLRARRIASARAVKTGDTPGEDAQPKTENPAEEAPPRVSEVAAGAEEEVRAAPIPRRRIRLETRAQMLDRLTNPTISLHEASVILKVCAATVRRLCDAGTLPHERTAGGQRRFRLAEVMKLYRARHDEKTSK